MFVVNSFWYGSPITTIGELCIESFIKNGFEFHLWSYDPNIKVPNGCIVKDANEILDESLIFRLTQGNAKGSVAPFSDWFRFKLLYEQGGTWVDMDMVCLQPFEIQPNSICGEEDGRISMGIISLEKGHPMAKEMVDCYTNPCVGKQYDTFFRLIKKKELSSLPLQRQREQMPWGFLGNDVLNLIYKNYNFNVLSTHDFYPIKCEKFYEIFLGNNDLNILGDAKCIHLWGEIIRFVKLKIDKNYNKNTLFGKLLDKFLPLR